MTSWDSILNVLCWQGAVGLTWLGRAMESAKMIIPLKLSTPPSAPGAAAAVGELHHHLMSLGTKGPPGASPTL